jgi:hypothetical protein
MAEIIKFPNTAEKEYVNATQIAKEAARQMKETEEFLNYRLNFPDWNEYKLSENDVEHLALFGSHMKLAPVVGARLASKLAEILCKIRYCDPLDDL